MKTLVCTALLLLPACVIRLADRNAPEENGDVTGAPANCSQIPILPKGAPGGDAAPKFVGRFLTDPATPDLVRFDWSGNEISLRVQGTTHVTVKLRLEGIEAICGATNCVVPQDQMFAFFVDGKGPDLRRITVKNDAHGVPTLEPQEEYEITLPSTDAHEITVHKNTEAQKGIVQYKGFDVHGGTILPPTRRPRRIEFIGDSIVCGYGDRGGNATCPFEIEVRKATMPDGTPVKNVETKEPLAISVPITEDQSLSFSAIAARELDADAVTVCWSGRGVYLNYKEQVGEQAEESKITMPTFWETRTLGSTADPPWDFTKEKPEDAPQVVVISLGTNDFSRDNLPVAQKPGQLNGNNVPDGDMDSAANREKFFQAYQALVRSVRTHRGPQTHIFLATPPMVTDQYPLDNARTNIRNALRRIVAEQEKIGDHLIYQMDLVEMGTRYGMGCDYHPNLEVQRIMATQLVGAIRSKTCW